MAQAAKFENTDGANEYGFIGAVAGAVGAGIVIGVYLVVVVVVVRGVFWLINRATGESKPQPAGWVPGTW